MAELLISVDTEPGGNVETYCVMALISVETRC